MPNLLRLHVVDVEGRKSIKGLQVNANGDIFFTDDSGMVTFSAIQSPQLNLEYFEIKDPIPSSLVRNKEVVICLNLRRIMGVNLPINRTFTGQRLVPIDKRQERFSKCR